MQRAFWIVMLVRLWPEGDDRNGIRHVSSRGQTGHSGDAPKST